MKPERYRTLSPRHPVLVRTVLVIDDDPLLADLFAQTLTDAGFEVTKVTSATAAVAALEAREYFAILSDIRLPGMNGLQLYELVRERFPSAVPRFGFCTAWDDAGARELMTRHNIPLLRKPCTLNELEEFVRRMMPEYAP